MDILKPASAGTLESSDIFITIAPNAEKGIVIDLESIVEKQFSEAILKVIHEVLKAYEVDNAVISAVDKGALDCTIKARMETAVERAGGTNE